MIIRARAAALPRVFAVSDPSAAKRSHSPLASPKGRLLTGSNLYNTKRQNSAFLPAPQTRDQTIADAFIDRLIHSSYKINLKGDSMKKNNSQNFLPLD
ncbi:MAG: ATP-binding protein [Spirochaetota bacterium]